jgi:hypothetical protein
MVISRIAVAGFATLVLVIPSTARADVAFHGSSQASAGAVTSIAIQLPTTTQVADVAVAVVDASVGPGAITPPSGWTLVSRWSATRSPYLTQAVYDHVVAAGDPSVVRFGLPAATRVAAGIAAYGGVDPATPVGATSVGHASSSATATAPSLSVGVNGGAVVSAFGSASASTATLSSGLTERVDVDATGGSPATAAAGDRSISAVGATGSTTARFTASGKVVGMQIALQPQQVPGAPLLRDTFDAPNGPNNLITNEFAFWNPGSGVVSPTWEMDSGSAFSITPAASVGAQGNVGWTGIPDTCGQVDEYSRGCTNSNVFRLDSKRRDFGNVGVSVDGYNRGYTVASPDDWDGIELWLRYQSEYQLYIVKPERYDGHVTIQKKCPGGSSNGGTYYMLFEQSGHPFPFSAWLHLSASARTNADGTVTITVSRDGQLIGQATDAGGRDIYGASERCGPITASGGVGIRGDNDDFYFDNFEVDALG